MPGHLGIAAPDGPLERSSFTIIVIKGQSAGKIRQSFAETLTVGWPATLDSSHILLSEIGRPCVKSTLCNNPSIDIEAVNRTESRACLGVGKDGCAWALSCLVFPMTKALVGAGIDLGPFRGNTDACPRQQA